MKTPKFKIKRKKRKKKKKTADNPERKNIRRERINTVSRGMAFIYYFIGSIVLFIILLGLLGIK